MMQFIRAHGYDPGPTQRPLLAGALSALVAAPLASAVFVAFGSFQVTADEVLRLPRAGAALLFLGAFVLAGVLYGAFFRRAANDRRAGWLLGISYGFLLWIVAPIVTIPLLGAGAMAAGAAATGFLVAFLVWGLTIGLAFPYVHRPLHADLESDQSFGPDAVGLKQRLLRRPGQPGT